MPSHHFGVTRKPITRAQSDALSCIAARFDASFVHVRIAGNRARGWFSCANRGAPFDVECERAVMKAVREAGFGDLFE